MGRFASIFLHILASTPTQHCILCPITDHFETSRSYQISYQNLQKSIPPFLPYQFQRQPTWMRRSDALESRRRRWKNKRKTPVGGLLASCRNIHGAQGRIFEWKAGTHGKAAHSLWNSPPKLSDRCGTWLSVLAFSFY